MDKGFYSGSKWWKFDFHTHTPASEDYGRRDGSLKNLSPEEWLQHAMQSGIDCVVVTDHNSGDWINNLKAKNKELHDCNEKPEWYRELIIFPGVEITVANSSSRVHLLAVFDPSCNGQNIIGILGACGITSEHGNPDSFTRCSFVETVKHIKEAGGIAIPAHIDSKQGLLKDIESLTPELEQSLKNVSAAEFCKLDAFENTEHNLKEAVNNLAKVAGSDAHTPNDIGKHFSWIKMGRPSIEGLKLAFQDHESNVKNQNTDPNKLPQIYLSKLTIKSMRHCGRIKEHPFVTEFHPLFNSIIGGRGTGKSTILESIRIVSRRDQDLSIEAPKIMQDLNNFMKKFDSKGVMQDDTEITLELYRNNNHYKLHWRFDGQGNVLEKEDNNTWYEIEPTDIKERFPISIFSQKQINELATNPRGLLNIIDRSPEIGKTEWLSRWDSTISKFLQLREHNRGQLKILSNEQQIRAKLQDIEDDLKQYEEKGHGEILKQYQRRSQQKNVLPVVQTLDDLSSAVRELASNTSMSDFPSYLFDDDDETAAEIKTIHERATHQLTDICLKLEGIANGIDNLKLQMTKDFSSSKWYQAVKASIEAYNRLVAEYENKNSQLSITVYKDWVHQRNLLQSQLEVLESTRKEENDTEEHIKELHVELQKLRTELFEKRKRFLKKAVGGSNYVRMELVPFGDVSTLEHDYRKVLGLDDDTYVSSIYDSEGRQGILRHLKEWEESKIPESEIPSIISVLKNTTYDIAIGKISGNHASFDRRLQKLNETQPYVFDKLDSWWPEDQLRVKFSKDPSSGKFDDLEKGSAGQKAAAILAFLLSHGNEPLIIDQPEDDLDNALIYDLIVKQIKENKDRRQLIIVTHNANIVVNGDSELVHVLKFSNGQIQIDKEGSIDESHIRESICNIMEGGRQAFIKRYNRIAREE